MSYVADLVGVDHVGLGIDYFTGQDGIMPLAEAQDLYDFMLQVGSLEPSRLLATPMDLPRRHRNARQAAEPDNRPPASGFFDDDVKKILGENWLRVFEAVWG